MFSGSPRITPAHKPRLLQYLPTIQGVGAGNVETAPHLACSPDIASCSFCACSCTCHNCHLPASFYPPPPPSYTEKHFHSVCKDFWSGGWDTLNGSTTILSLPLPKVSRTIFIWKHPHVYIYIHTHTFEMQNWAFSAGETVLMILNSPPTLPPVYVLVAYVKAISSQQLPQLSFEVTGTKRKLHFLQLWHKHSDSLYQTFHCWFLHHFCLWSLYKDLPSPSSPTETFSWLV